MVSQELLDILRCPVCVHNEPEGGELVHRGNWLICQDCDRKYPIRDEIPVMLIDEGDRFREIPQDSLPDVPPPEKVHPAPALPVAAGMADYRRDDQAGGRWTCILPLSRPGRRRVRTRCAQVSDDGARSRQALGAGPGDVE